MSLLRSSRLRLSLLLLGVSICSADARARRAPAAPATGTFDHLTFSNTSGRVGYHMFASFGVYDWDTPTGNSATCAFGAGDSATSGTVPPGLVLLANYLTSNFGLKGFEGTPRQPGDWTVSVVIKHVECFSGPDQTDYGPKTVEVHFHIDP